MNVLDMFGTGGIGFVFGYLLFYAVRHTENFNVTLLSSALGAVGSQAILEMFFKEKTGVLGSYGTGLFSGFAFYFAIVYWLTVKFAKLGKPIPTDSTKLTFAPTQPSPSNQFDPDRFKLSALGKGLLGKALDD